MLLDDAKKVERARRRGFARRFILALIWLGLTIAAASYVIGWLFETGRLSYNRIIVNLNLPASVDQELIRIGLIVLVVVVIQFFTLLLVGFLNPAGRQRTGTPTLKTRAPQVDERRMFRK